MGGSRSSGSSSGEEDGDAEWRAAIDSVATVFSKPHDSTDNIDENVREKKSESHAFKLYQIKAQKLLDDLLEKSLMLVQNPNPASDEIPQGSEDCIRLFSQAPPGIIFDPIDDLIGPRKRPRILPAEELDEKSKKFRRRVQSVAVDGDDIVAAAKNACQRSLARFEAKDAAAKVKAKEEEERVADLKRIRGEKWLPSIAREMQVSLVKTRL
ncbi:uncharacterized protein LOC143851761 [Tasmannia lanceolata]|uniref:uncharacterized protein LOC143851761 n=1 Tax=Tasmannia lanceolata TaxID=3420 RepID=UPI0040632ADA